jgi:serine protease Do
VERSSNLIARNRTDSPQPGRNEEAETSRLGISVRAITPEVAARLNLKQDTGVLVASVQPGSSASQAGINHGDVIHQIGTTKIASVDEFIEATRTLKSGDNVAVKIERNRRMTFVTIPLD